MSSTDRSAVNDVLLLFGAKKKIFGFMPKLHGIHIRAKTEYMSCKGELKLGGKYSKLWCEWVVAVTFFYAKFKIKR